MTEYERKALNTVRLFPNTTLEFLLENGDKVEILDFNTKQIIERKENGECRMVAPPKLTIVLGKPMEGIRQANNQSVETKGCPPEVVHAEGEKTVGAFEGKGW